MSCCWIVEFFNLDVHSSCGRGAWCVCHRVPDGVNPHRLFPWVCNLELKLAVWGWECCESKGREESDYADTDTDTDTDTESTTTATDT